MRSAITMKHSILLMMIMSISIMIAVLTGTAPVYCDADDMTHEKGSCSDGGNDSTATDSTSPETKPKDEKYVQILNMARNMEQELIDIRRQLHRRPATMYEEYEAQEIVIDTLNKLRLRFVLCSDQNDYWSVCECIVILYLTLMCHYA